MTNCFNPFNTHPPFVVDLLVSYPKTVMYGDGWIQMLDSETGMIRNHFYCIVRYTEWQSSPVTTQYSNKRRAAAEVEGDPVQVRYTGQAVVEQAEVQAGKKQSRVG